MKIDKQADRQLLWITGTLLVVVVLLLYKQRSDMLARANAGIAGQQMACRDYGMTGKQPDPCDVLRTYKPTPEAVRDCDLAHGSIRFDGWCR